MPDQSPNRPEWATSGDYAIHREDYTDKNYVRKAVYDASQGPKRRLNVWGWDDRSKSFKNPFTVVANENGLGELARAMEKLMPNFAAHFYGGPGSLTLFMLDGHKLPKPVPFKNVSFNEHPANDWQLVRDMPEKLDIIRDKRLGYPQSVQSLKAWINVEKGSVIKFPAAQKFDKIISDAPEKFNIPHGVTLLQARIAAEREGWVAFGINAEDNDNVIAVVQAMNERQARRAVMAMWKVKKVEWAILKIVTNDGSKSLKGEEIARYVGGKVSEAIDLTRRAFGRLFSRDSISLGAQERDPFLE